MASGLQLPGMNEKNFESSCCTDLIQDKFCYKWTINNWKTICSIDKPHVSEIFSANEDVKWRLKLQEFKGTLHIYLQLINNTRGALNVQYAFSVYSAGKLIISFKSEITNTANLGSEYVSISDELRKGTNENITIICDISILTIVTSIVSNPSNDLKIRETKIGQDLGILLENNKLSDVMLVVDGRDYPAHKSILAARSEVFAAMFEHEMEENKLNHVVITDIDHGVLNEMLRFIYTDKVPNLKEMPGDLLMAADKYALSELKSMCEEALYINISVETAAETLVLADLHSAGVLKAKTLNFITTYPIYVMKTKGWQDMTTSHPDLFSEAYEALATRFQCEKQAKKQ